MRLLYSLALLLAMPAQAYVVEGYFDGRLAGHYSFEPFDNLPQPDLSRFKPLAPTGRIDFRYQTETDRVLWASFDFGTLEGQTTDPLVYGALLFSDIPTIGIVGAWSTTFGDAFGRVHNIVRSRMNGTFDAGPEFGTRIWGLDYEFVDSTLHFKVPQPSSLALALAALAVLGALNRKTTKEK